MSVVERPASSLQRRLLWRVLGAVGALWLMAALLVGLDARHELGELLDAHLAQSAALLIARQTPDADGVLDDAVQLPVAPDLHRYNQRVAFQIWHEGQLLLRSANAPAAPMTTLSEGFETHLIDGQAWRLFVAQGGEADVQVQVAELMSSRQSILMAVMRGMLAPLLLGLPLLGLLVWGAVRRGLLPLRTLQEQLHTRDPQALSPLPVEVRTPAEVAQLRDALNQLFARMADLLDSERRFTADAAHELRTPIAAIRAQAQVAQGAADDVERRHALQATVAGCDRASHLVQQLLTLSRVEAAPAADSHRLDLGVVTRSVAAELAGQALDRRQDLTLDAPTGCWLQADEVLLRVLLRNLLDNASRYSPDGATVSLQVRVDGTQVLLQVDDSGPGMAPADLARLGERFFRALGQTQPGSGLGLSIVRRIVAAQGGTLQARASDTLGGLCVSVCWPLAAGPQPAAEGAAG
jgi:two-component system, OmpR family, sensor histidine kinase QseC